MADPFSSMVSAFNSSTGLAQLLDSPVFNISNTSQMAKLVVFIILIIIAAKIVIIIANKLIERALTQGKIIDKRLKVDQFKLKSTQKIVRYIIWFLAVILILQNLGIEVTALVAALGIGGIALAFGAQETIANIIAGFVLMADKPFKIGDRIALAAKGTQTLDQTISIGGDNWGDIIDIGLRSTKVKTANNVIVIIPNAEFTKRDIWNFTLGDTRIRLVLNANISYESNQDMAKKIMLELCKKDARILKDPAPDVLFRGFGDNGVHMSTRFWIRDAKDAQEMTSEMYQKIKTEFDLHGIEIPYPRRQLIYDKDFKQEFAAKRKQTKIKNNEEEKLIE